MRKPRSKDDYWYTKLTNAEPKKVYRECPNCGKRVAIPTIYPTQFCYMCKTTIYVDEELNEKEKGKYKFLNELRKKGITNDTKKKKYKKKIWRVTNDDVKGTGQKPKLKRRKWISKERDSQTNSRKELMEKWTI